LGPGVKNSAIKMCLLLIIFPVSSAHAFIDTPVFAPLPIRANQSFTTTIRVGECDLFPAADTPINVMLVSPNRLQLFVTGIHQTNPLLCFPVISSPVFTLPPLPAGNYKFELYVRNLANPAIPIHNGPIVPFTVVAAEPLIQVSTLNRFGLVTLILLLLSGAMLGRWREK
jgi:hypothetical protein